MRGAPARGSSSGRDGDGDVDDDEGDAARLPPPPPLTMLPSKASSGYRAPERSPASTTAAGASVPTVVQGMAASVSPSEWEEAEREIFSAMKSDSMSSTATTAATNDGGDKREKKTVSPRPAPRLSRLFLMYKKRKWTNNVTQKKMNFFSSLPRRLRRSRRREQRRRRPKLCRQRRQRPKPSSSNATTTATAAALPLVPDRGHVRPFDEHEIPVPEPLERAAPPGAQRRSPPPPVEREEPAREPEHVAGLERGALVRARERERRAGRGVGDAGGRGLDLDGGAGLHLAERGGLAFFFLEGEG